MVEPVRAARNPKYSRLVWMMASQMGKTANQFNVMGHRLDDDPAPILYVGPTQSTVRTIIEPKITEMLRSTPSLKKKLAHNFGIGTKRSGKTIKWVGGIPLRLAWAGSAAELASDAAAIGFIDELDRMEDSIKGEGDPVELIEARTSTYPDGRIIITSTPTIGAVEAVTHPDTGMQHWKPAQEVTSPVWRFWQEGTRHEWSWPCPLCDEFFVPRMSLLSWPEDSTLGDIARKTVIICPSCHGEIESKKKESMNKRGVFVMPGQSVTKEGVVLGEGDTHDTDTMSFWISGIATFASKKTFGFLARRYVAAVRSGKFERIQAVLNTEFGELFAMKGEAPRWEAVWGRRLPYEAGAIPNGVLALTCGVDVQKNCLVYGVRGWGKDKESWLIKQGELWGDTSKREVWEQLEELLTTPICGMYIALMAVDSGYRASEVYTFVARHSKRVLATKGHASLDKPHKATKIEVTRTGKVKKVGSIMLWHFDSDILKSWVHARVDWPTDAKGGWWLNYDVTEDYCQQVVAEGRVAKANGKITWVKTYAQNHYLDVEALNYLAVQVLNPNFTKLASRKATEPPDAVMTIEDEKGDEVEATVTTQKRKRTVAKRSKSSWTKGY